jgi:hypothetical protein
MVPLALLVFGAISWLIYEVDVALTVSSDFDQDAYIIRTIGLGIAWLAVILGTMLLVWKATQRPIWLRNGVRLPMTMAFLFQLAGTSLFALYAVDSHFSLDVGLLHFQLMWISPPLFAVGAVVMAYALLAHKAAL